MHSTDVLTICGKAGLLQHVMYDTKNIRFAGLLVRLRCLEAFQTS